MRSNTFKTFVLSLSLLFTGNNLFCQTLFCDNCAIISFDEVYDSNLITFQRPAYSYLYLVISDKAAVEKMLFSLSKKKYTSMNNIIDSLKSNFKLYTIKKSESDKSVDANKTLLDLNKYDRGFLFSLKDEIRGPVKNYIIKKNGAGLKIGYSIINPKLSQIAIDNIN